MRLFLDDPLRVTRVRWYRVNPKTPTLGVPTVFTSSVWDDGIQLPAIGEVRASRKWKNVGPGRLTLVASPGLCGSAEQFAHGCHTTDPLPEVLPGSGQPACCGKAIDVPCNGVVLRIERCLPVRVFYWRDPIPTCLSIFFYGGTGHAAFLNGFHAKIEYDAVRNLWLNGQAAPPHFRTGQILLHRGAAVPSIDASSSTLPAQPAFGTNQVFSGSASPFFVLFPVALATPSEGVIPPGPIQIAVSE